MKSEEIKSTIRKCNECDYETFVLKDNLREKGCEYCKGLMKIILIGEKRK